MKDKTIKTMFLKFWRTEDNKVSLIRDVLVALLFVLILLLALWTYTGQWFSTPMVAIESGSMTHVDEPFGRLGTINAGDMVFLVKVNDREDIVTRGQKMEIPLEDDFFYGDHGDVVVYKKYGNPNAQQIIHRAICWIEYHENNTYSVEEYGIHYVGSITISNVGLKNYQPKHSGFITQGDNPITNPTCDQVGLICTEPIKTEWITGKARGELPWIGTLNLFFGDLTSGAFFNPNVPPNTNNVPSDCITCLIALIAVLISIPISLDVYDWYKTKNR
ncbi:MAG: S26 family signal peptidase [Candidatus Thermoplasmatota archaeon]|nr:S26 family signal peptidase [Candidatus Thermoplasmatota archaeon]